jgi:omega-6 fatty acid desaturase (delta-12 desaturase)
VLDIPASAIALTEAERRGAPAMADDLKATVRRLAAHCARYRGSVERIAIRQLATTLVPLFAIFALMLATVETHYWLTLLLAIPAAGLLVRVFIIQHDCGHGAFLKSRAANDLVGRFCSILTLTPYGLWRREHALHHASSGNLERRGAGDINTLTVHEYAALPLLQKVRYRIYRHPLFLFGFGVPFFFLILQRVPWFHPVKPKDAWPSVMALNAAIVVVYGALSYVAGASYVFWVAWPTLHAASAIGGWLFFIQHQFEETHWEHGEDWDFQIAAVMGSSYYALHPVLNWFTGDIGLHHIHHLNSMIPNYRLQDCLKASPELQSMNKLTLMESFKCARLKLWDEDNRRLVGFSDVR